MLLFDYVCLFKSKTKTIMSLCILLHEQMNIAVVKLKQSWRNDAVWLFFDDFLTQRMLNGATFKLCSVKHFD